MRYLIRATVAAVFGLTAAAPMSATAESILGITSGGNLVRFDSATPGTVPITVAVTGLQAGETLLAIDRRPATGDVYGLGSTSRLYRINETTGAATQIGSAGAFTLNGTAFGFDFNPTVDRIRVVSVTGQNIRLNPNDGTLTATDPALSLISGTPRVVGAAYTNNVAGAVTTLLYDIDSSLDALLLQNPPNTGMLTSIGSLGFNTSDLVGFDVSGLTDIAYASLSPVTGGPSQLFTVNLSTGAATLVGTIGTGLTLVDIALPIGAAVPELETLSLLGTGLAAMATAAGRRLKRRLS